VPIARLFAVSTKLHMDHLKLATQSVVKQWELITLQATRLLNQLTDEDLNRQVAPGKNTGKYIIGHLIAINDAIPQNLGIAESQHPELMNSYVSQPDGVAEDVLSLDELRMLWKETNRTNHFSYHAGQLRLLKI
jgi:hypothetical protein